MGIQAWASAAEEPVWGGKPSWFRHSPCRVQLGNLPEARETWHKPSCASPWLWELGPLPSLILISPPFTWQ